MATTNASASKSAPKKQSQGFTGIKSAFSVMVGCLVIALAIYLFVFGNISNFRGGEDTGVPFSFLTSGDVGLEPANLMGTVYKGGFIVPIIWTMFFTVLALSIERFFAIRTAYGRTSLTKFVENIKKALQANDFNKAVQLCDAQCGSVANVVRATLKKYQEMDQTDRLTKEQKILAIQKELEEATALEMPMLQENLPVLGTIITLGTLMGLLGTVLWHPVKEVLTPPLFRPVSPRPLLTRLPVSQRVLSPLFLTTITRTKLTV